MQIIISTCPLLPALGDARARFTTCLCEDKGTSLGQTFVLCSLGRKHVTSWASEVFVDTEVQPLPPNLSTRQREKPAGISRPGAPGSGLFPKHEASPSLPEGRVSGAELPFSPRAQYSIVVCSAWKLAKHCHPHYPPLTFSLTAPPPGPVGSLMPFPLEDSGFLGLPNSPQIEPMSLSAAAQRGHPARWGGGTVCT